MNLNDKIYKTKVVNEYYSDLLKEKLDKRFYNGKKYIDDLGNVYNWQLVKINFVNKGIPTIIQTVEP